MTLLPRFAGLALVFLLLPACGISGGGTLNPAIAPASPANVTALPGNESVTLTWIPSSVGAGYSVGRALSFAGPFVQISVPQQFLTPTSYQDTGLSNGVTYYYVVMASNAFGTSAPSLVVSATPGFRATSIAAGIGFGMALLPDLSVWAWGDDEWGQIPNPLSIRNNNPPLEVSGLQGVVSIAAGQWVGVAQLADGSVWEWGGHVATPVQVQNLSGITAIAAGGVLPFTGISVSQAGGSFGLALKFDGTVWGWTGVGGSATQIQTPPGIVAIAAGSNFQLALRNDGTVWAWGDNSYGQLGNGSSGNGPFSTPAQVANLSGVTAIAAGTAHCLALRSDGTVWAWGANRSGQLGTGSTSSSDVTLPDQVQLPQGSVMTSISAGDTHSLALRADGTVWAWGDNTCGELGTGSASTTPVVTPVQVQNLSQATEISAGGEWSLAVFNGGSVCAWGVNNLGQLGSGQGQEFSAPTEVNNLTGATAISTGGAFSLALREGGILFGWGDNSTGELGLGTAAAVSPFPAQVAPAGTSFTAISAGPNFGLAVDSAGAVWAWGDNTYGEIGNGSSSATPVTSPVKVTLPAGSVFTSVAAGANFGMALRSDGTVWGWGDNTYGELGNGAASTTPVTSPVQVVLPAGSVVTALAAGPGFGIALRNDGTAWAWGDNTSAELGNGAASATPVTTPVQVGLPAGSVITAISAGGGTYTSNNHGLPVLVTARFALALRSDGTVWGWGSNPYGNVGNGSSGLISGTLVTTPAQAELPAGATFTAISAGALFGLALRSDGTVWGWGENSSGNLGSLNSLTPGQVNSLTGVQAISAGGSSMLMLLANQEVGGQGDNSTDELGTRYLSQSTSPVFISH